MDLSNETLSVSMLAVGFTEVLGILINKHIQAGKV